LQWVNNGSRKGDDDDDSVDSDFYDHYGYYFYDYNDYAMLFDDINLPELVGLEKRLSPNNFGAINQDVPGP